VEPQFRHAKISRIGESPPGWAMLEKSSKSLESWIWDAACSIRGAKDAPKYKEFILPLIFAKRLCDVFDDEIEPRTPEGLERSRRANWKHGHSKAERSRVRAAILAVRYLRDSI
jgi:HsdM N-terminal domain